MTKERLNKLNNIKQKLIALSLVGTVATTMVGCSKNDSKTNNSSSTDASISMENKAERARDLAAVHKLFSGSGAVVKLAEEYNYDTIMNWGIIQNNSNLIDESKIAKIASKTFDHSYNLADDIKWEPVSWFYKYDDMLEIPDTYNMYDQEDLADFRNFYSKFNKEVTIDVYKEDTLYYTVTNIHYTCDFSFPEDIGIKIGDEMGAIVIESHIYDELNKEMSSYVIAKEQYGIGCDDANVLSKNVGGVDCFTKVNPDLEEPLKKERIVIW